MCNALWAAYASERPLLIKGDPGIGKSELAYAIAAHLKWPLVKKVIQGNTELDHLHFRYDAVKRLADAQIYASISEKGKVAGILDVANYIAPGPIWWAFNWQDALGKLKKSPLKIKEPPKPEGWEPGDGCVLLIDEIDKADPDLPNGLLESFGNRCFEVPLLGEDIKCKQPVLTIITTNEERELPPPFLRRCLVLTLEIETSEETRLEWMAKRGRLHFDGEISEDIYLSAAKEIWKQREAADGSSKYQTGLAEYLDLLAALSHAPMEDQENILDRIAKFVLEKG
jgi:MoxR-like ATPase